MSTKVSTSQAAKDKVIEKLLKVKLKAPPVRKAYVLTREDRMGRAALRADKVMLLSQQG